MQSPRAATRGNLVEFGGARQPAAFAGLLAEPLQRMPPLRPSPRRPPGGCRLGVMSGFSQPRFFDERKIDSRSRRDGSLPENSGAAAAVPEAPEFCISVTG